MESPLAIANYFIKKSLDTGQLITPMKLTKLVYIAHGWYLGLTKQPLISEGAEAWKYGPVIPSIYYSFKSYGGNPITALVYTVSETGQTILYSLSEPGISDFLDKIWEIYSKYTAVELSALTHQEDSPWYEVWNNRGGSENYGVVIPNDCIEQHYQHLAEANLAQDAIA